MAAAIMLYKRSDTGCDKYNVNHYYQRQADLEAMKSAIIITYSHNRCIGFQLSEGSKL
jgi:hypothetical protein